VRPADATRRRPTRKDSGVSLQRIAWLSTVVVFLVIALILLLRNYHGYPALALAIAAAAAINLF